MIAENISELIHAGYKQRQAIAIAFDRAGIKKKGGKNEKNGN